MRRAWPLLVLLLLGAAGLSGVALKERHHESGVALSASHIPLGGFEPLGTGYFWMRAEEMRGEGRLVEAVANYRMVAALQPRVAPAFALPARLLAWTRSESGEPEREWEWVLQGLAFVETGLTHSPDDPVLVFELGFIWYARVALDEALRLVAIEKSGRMPEEFALEQFRRLEPSEEKDAFLADTLRLLADRHYEAEDFDGALSAYREALPFWSRFAEEGADPRAVEYRDGIRLRIDELLARTREK